MNIAYVGLGSNIEPRKEHLDKALRMLEQSTGIRHISESAIYETIPVDYLDQADFLNMVVELQTTLQPLDLLACCQKIEKRLGRERVIDKGPRTMDLDILLYNEEEIQLDELKVPHPRLHERAFVLVPLSKLAPKVFHPVHQCQLETLLDRLPKKEIAGVKQWEE